MRRYDDLGNPIDEQDPAASAMETAQQLEGAPQGGSVNRLGMRAPTRSERRVK